MFELVQLDCGGEVEEDAAAIEGLRRARGE